MVAVPCILREENLKGLIVKRTLVVLIIAGLTLVGGGVWGWNHRTAGSTGDMMSSQPAAPPLSPTAPPVVHLATQKQQAAEIKVGPVVERAMAVSRTVPGRLRYDERWHIEVKIPTEGMLAEVRVKPGQSVQQGQVLALLHSPEVGTARADVLKHQALCELADRVHARKKKVTDGVRQLVAAVQAGRSPQEVTDAMEDVSLGAYRSTILQAYSRYRLAQALTKNLAPLGDRGAVPGRLVKQRMSDRESAQAALATAMEQASYQADQECAEARLAVEDARRRLRISQQHLHTLLGYTEYATACCQHEALSTVEVRAAFQGTIEAQLLSVSERVEQGAALFVLANTSQLWVAADIREQEWAALQLTEGQPLTLTTPALPDQEFPAQVYYVGREVELDTNAVSLIATVDNQAGLLRPGQFMRVVLPLGKSRRVIAVPETAIVEHESRPFVFVASRPGEYRHGHVELGVRSDGWVELRSGVDLGERVVTEGAFYLKSELLLDGE